MSNTAQSAFYTLMFFQSSQYTFDIKGKTNFRNDVIYEQIMQSELNYSELVLPFKRNNGIF